MTAAATETVLPIERHDDDDDDGPDHYLDKLLQLVVRPESAADSMLWRKITTTTTSSKSSTKKKKVQQPDTTTASTTQQQQHARQQLKMLQRRLQKTCASIFSEIEALGQKYQSLIAADHDDGIVHRTTTTSQPTASLSGLAELYIGDHNDDDKVVVMNKENIGNVGDATTTDDDNNDVVGVDAETIWSQVELQNSVVHKLLKRSLFHIGRCEDPSDVQLLLMEDSDNDADDDDDDNNVDDSDEEQHDDNDDVEDAVSNGKRIDETEDQRRIRERMERAMKDMEDEDEDHDEDNEEADSDENDMTRHDPKQHTTATNDEDDLDNDPDAVNLHDGFFNLHEMEAFADEEEEYLPDEAFGEERPEDNNINPQQQKSNKNKDHRSFHQKQRDGDMDDSGDSDDDDEDDAGFFQQSEESMVRRRRYRNDDEIDALLRLYDDNDQQAYDDDSEDEDNDDDDDAVINMTAADLFGKPNRKYYDKWKTKASDGDGSRESSLKQQRNRVDDDNVKASWTDYKDDDDDPDENSASNDDQDEEEEHEVNSDAADDESINDNSERQNVEDRSDARQRDTSSSRGGSTTLRSKQQAKLQTQTEQLEREMLAEKPWQMKGETGSSSRPMNSLLESTPEFEVASKVAPVITVESTADLESIIRKRILAEDWDDVVPRELPDIGWHKKRGEAPEVSQEKSKLGLGELYEREYLKKAVGYDVDATTKQTEEDKAKAEMKALFASLCSKLDALSNYHFAPRPIAEDVAEVRPITVPAIAMEEVLPIHFSDARGVAPEEVYGVKRGRESILRDESELDPQELKRRRRSKKAVRRKARQAKAADEKLLSRLQPSSMGLSNPYEKRKIREELSMARAGGKVTTGTTDTNDYGGSNTFFQRMQREAQETIRNSSDQASSGGDRLLPKETTNRMSSQLKL